MAEITRLLIANRGEIALRVMRTARELGIRTVAVHSTADAASLHVQAAHQAVPIGDAAPDQSYLNIGKIIGAAKASGADAVHPGYGFLAENAAFARACREAGLIFVGPSAEAIDAMGDKANAKILMRRAGVPCVPGYDGESQDPAVLREAASQVGYPVMIKATAGGGGRGMRIADCAEHFDAALVSAKSEALHAFGSDNVILERVIRNPRHIEIQVVADRQGNVIHLGERDCSVQRRHQKVIEEAPGVGISDALRDAMGQAAVSAARAIGYEGVGTLEFLLDDDGHFYFMEMNTRLQVEHPVTEAITGCDLVAMQLAIAQGKPLALTQEEVRFSGHAIEVRLCAEDESQNFMPQSGIFTRWQAPEGVRVETAVQSGSEMSPYYDSMFAKIIAFGRDRDEARLRLAAALSDTVVFGVKTNKGLLSRCLLHPLFARGGVHTGFLETCRAELFVQADDAPEEIARLAAALLCATDRPVIFGSTVAGKTALVHLRQSGRTTTVAAYVGAREGDIFDVTFGDRTSSVRVTCTANGWAQVSTGQIASRVAFARTATGIDLQIEGETFSFDDVTYVPAARADSEGAADGGMRAAMSGRVAAVYARPGAAVSKGDVLVTIEAMKMEHQHRALVDGVISEVNVGVGNNVAPGRLLVVIQPLAALAA